VRTKPTVENDDAEQGDAEHVSVLGVDLGITNIANHLNRTLLERRRTQPLASRIRKAP